MVYAGIDVSKGKLDLALLIEPGGKATLRSFSNNEQGYDSLIALLSGVEPSSGQHGRSDQFNQPSSQFKHNQSKQRSLRRPKRLALLVLESSGVYHLPLLQRLVASGIPVALVNPYQVAAFRKASGVRNKTDTQDALLLAKYALAYREELVHYQPPPRVVTELKEVLTYREQLLSRLRQVENQVEVVFWKLAAKRDSEHDSKRNSIYSSKRNSKNDPERTSKHSSKCNSKHAPNHDSKTLAWLREEEEQIKARLVEVEAEVQRLLQLIPESEVLMLQKGVGAQVAAAVLAYLPPELWGKAKQASSYAGLIPEQFISGSSVRKSRLSRKGPTLLRKKLYLAALVAIRHDPEMKAFYFRLLANHKTKKQALIAVAHKLLRRLMGKLKAYYKEQGRGPLVA